MNVMCYVMVLRKTNYTRCSAVSLSPAAASLMLHTQIACKVFLAIGKVDFGVF